MSTLTETQLQTLSGMRDQPRQGTIGYWQIYAWLVRAAPKQAARVLRQGRQQILSYESRRTTS